MCCAINTCLDMTASKMFQLLTSLKEQATIRYFDSVFLAIAQPDVKTGESVTEF